MCPHRLLIRTLFATLFVVISTSFISEAQTKRKLFIPGRRAVVVDERLSALRTQPDAKSKIKQRLRRGRAVGILGAATAQNGTRFLLVAMSRNTRGWVLAEAITRAGNAADAERLLKLIEETEDDFAKARLARLCADEFRATGVAPKALMILASAAEKAADRLTREARRRSGDEEPKAGLNKRDYFLNYVGLDRYNRIGVMFDFDENGDRIVYDGRAYRELLRRYPKSDDAKTAIERVAKR